MKFGAAAAVSFGLGGVSRPARAAEGTATALGGSVDVAPAENSVYLTRAFDDGPAAPCASLRIGLLKRAGWNLDEFKIEFEE